MAAVDTNQAQAHTSDVLGMHVEVLDLLKGLTGLIQENHPYTEAFTVDDDVLCLAVVTLCASIKT